MTTQATREETTVAIVGGGVAGLTTAMMLRRAGVSCVVLERQSRAYVEQRQRAGLVEYRGVRMFTEWGLGHLLGTFTADNTMEVRVDGQSLFVGRDAHAQEHVGVLAPQQALVRNLVAAFLGDGGDLRFQAADVALSGLESQRPVVTYTDGDGTVHEISCDLIAGCDGDHGACRASIPDGVLTAYSRDYGVTWLAILADTPAPRYPSFGIGGRGYAAGFARGQKMARFYLEIPAGDTPADWPQDRIWAQLRERFWWPDLAAGPVTETEIVRLRSQVFEPMSYGRLYLLGDAAHVISPMGAKGMNLALYDAETFVKAALKHAQAGDDTGLRGYSDTCLERTWRYQEYADWFSQMFFTRCGDRAAADPYAARVARARLARFTEPSSSAALAWGELMTGLA
ncbi:MAG TPA: 4-hydroxybenzoate 3-monooxygenase [Trebonia sp.]|nr:4-hydroxybenzoate 3-monooxygenase [Trebonia sp.]